MEPVRVTDTLDLHGFFPEQIPDVMDAFLENARELHLLCLRVIHGKGRSRLKWEVHRFCDSHPEVLDYSDAPPELGGWGATLIRLIPPENHPS